MANWPNLVAHVHFEDGFGPEEAEHQFPRRALTRRIVLRNAVVIVPSRRLETIATQIWKLKQRSVHYIPNGVDCSRFSHIRTEPLVPRNSMPVMGTVALLRKEKNIARMIDAFRLIRETKPCRLVIAGDGVLRAELQAQAGTLAFAHDVVFTGYTANTERILASLDLFMLSSDTEQMPMSVIEAMAAGLPIVSTDVGDVAGMVSSANAPFIVSKDAASLARAAKQLLDNETLRRQVGAANQARAVAEFSQEKMFAAYSALFDGTM
jgi:glycosyltransferase involved in cell wall biosynthesis